jgi:hypothetical protein
VLFAAELWFCCVLVVAEPGFVGFCVAEPRFVDVFGGEMALLPPSWLFTVPRTCNVVGGGEALLCLPSMSAMGLTHASVHNT